MKKHLVVSGLSLLTVCASHAALIGDWRLDETSGALADASGSGQTLSIAGGAPNPAYAQAGVTNGTYGAITVSGASGTSVSFPASTYFAGPATNNTAVQNLGSGAAFTVLGWVNVSSLVANQSYRLLTTGTNSGGDGGWGLALQISNTGGDAGLRWTNFGVADNNSSAFTVTVGTWINIAATYNNGAISYYLNGNAVGTSTSSFTDESANGRLAIGNRYNGDTPDQLFGRIDGVRVYDSVLTAGQIQTAAAQSVSAVPEPSAYGLLGAGALAGVMAIRRRRRSR